MALSRARSVEGFQRQALTTPLSTEGVHRCDLALIPALLAPRIAGVLEAGCRNQAPWMDSCVSRYAGGQERRNQRQTTQASAFRPGPRRSRRIRPGAVACALSRSLSVGTLRGQDARAEPTRMCSQRVPTERERESAPAHALSCPRRCPRFLLCSRTGGSKACVTRSPRGRCSIRSSNPLVCRQYASPAAQASRRGC